MSIVGIFTQSRPEFRVPGGAALYFDATLQESTELQTDVTEFPIENGTVGHDHAVQRPLTITMRVGVSDNISRANRAQAGDLGAAAGNVAGTDVGRTISTLPSGVAAAVGVGGGAANAAFLAGRNKSRSQSALDAIREIQKTGVLIDVVGVKTEYKNCLITSTRQETNKENENALELVVELRQLIVVSTPSGGVGVPAQNDTAATQGQQTTNLGRLVPR